MSPMYEQGNIGNGSGTGYNQPPTGQMASNVTQPISLDSKITEGSEPILTVDDLAAILSVQRQTAIRIGRSNLSEQRADLRGDGPYIAREYYLSDVVSFLEKARGQPFPAGPIEPLLTPNEVAEILNVGLRSVTDWGKRGVLPVYKLSPHTFRYDLRDVKAFAENLNSKLTANEVADMLNLHLDTIYYWGNKNILPVLKLSPRLWRFDPNDVKAFAKSRGINIDSE